MLTCFLNGFRTSNVHNLKIYHSNLNRLYSSKIVNMQLRTAAWNYSSH